MTTLFLAWQDPQSRRWFTVGRLDSRPGLYEFAYTNGAAVARQEAGFEPLPAFPLLGKTYASQTIFPLFSNRLLPSYRSDFGEYLEWLNIPRGERDPMAILARSGGQRATDTLEVFPLPASNEKGDLEFHFLVHGLRHMTVEAEKRAASLKPGERLLLMRDVQNPIDPRAIALRTAESADRDVHLVGYVPRYLCDDFVRLAEAGSYPAIAVERVNPPPAPAQFRLLCKATLNVPAGFEPFSHPEFQPLDPSYSHQEEGVAGRI